MCMDIAARNARRANLVRIDDAEGVLKDALGQRMSSGNKTSPSACLLQVDWS